VDEAREMIRLIVVVAIVASIATFVVGAYVGVAVQRARDARVASQRRDALREYFATSHDSDRAYEREMTGPRVVRVSNTTAPLTNRTIDP
jgi:type II secretory pathway pseudopilin PulG